jgi:uncharacterized membrane protein HdeD (DUF308 family)
VIAMTMAGAPDRTVNYAFLLGGVTAAIFGLILIFQQEKALSLLMVILGLWWLIQGVFMLFSVFVDRTDVGWKIVLGLLGVVAGVWVLLNPGESADIFKGTIGVVLGVIGVLVGVTALFGSFRGAGFGAAVFGVVSILIGLLILFNAQFSTELLITLFAVLLLVDGVAAIYMAIKYR